MVPHSIYKQMAAVARCFHPLILMTEVKQCRARSVLGWETAWEHWVLLAQNRRFHSQFPSAGRLKPSEIRQGALNSNKAPRRGGLTGLRPPRRDGLKME